jgi:integrase
LWLRNVRAVQVTSVLQDIAEQHGLSKNSLKHIKSFLSGIFTFAKQQGFFDSSNPVQGAALPEGAEAEDQYAYSLDEIENMLRALPEPAATAIAVAAFAGLRRGEIRGLRWEGYDGQLLRVEQSIWESIPGKPKTRASKASVPVIATLRRKLDQHRMNCGSPPEGWMFASEKSTPLNLNNLLNRQILPALKSAGLEWHGFHAFRRALATNLHKLGVKSEDIQRILRHSDVATTQKHYILVNADDSKRELEKLESVMVARGLSSATKATKPELLN